MPMFSKIVSLFAENNSLQFAVPGGLIGVGTKVDPTLTRADRLVGQVLGACNSLPDIYVDLEISFFLLRKLLGVKSDASTKKQSKIKDLTKGEILMVNIGSTSTGGRVTAVKNDLAKLTLTAPVCTQQGEKLALSRRVDKHWRLIGWGKIRKGTKLDVSELSTQNLNRDQTMQFETETADALDQMADSEAKPSEEVSRDDEASKPANDEDEEDQE